jgi:hypothetical protein
LFKELMAAEDPEQRSLGRQGLDLSHTVGRTYTYYRRVADMDGDGFDDVLVRTIDYAEYDSSSAPGDYYYDLTLELLRGRDGKRLWKKDLSAVDGWFVALPALVGGKGANGLYLYAFDERSSAAYLTITAIDGSGNALWKASLGRGLGQGGSPITVLQTDALPGSATDILVGILEGRMSMPSPVGTVAGSTSASVIDGRDGTIDRHDDPESRLGTYPLVRPAPDLDGDGLRDYVFVDRWDPYAGSISDRGSGPVVARRGRDGEELWRSQNVLTGYEPEVYDVGDVTGDGKEDLVVTSKMGEGRSDRSFPAYLLDGADGRILWSGQAWFSMAAGDIDKDGIVDLITATPLSRRDEMGMRIEALRGDGSVIYSKTHELDAEVGGRPELSTYLYAPGDLTSDGHPDLLIDQVVYGRKYAAFNYLSDGRTGRRTDVPTSVVPAWGRLERKSESLVNYKRIDKYSVRVRAPWKVRGHARLQVDIRTRSLGSYPWTSSRAGRFGPTRCPGLMVSLGSTDSYGGSSVIVMFDSATGRALWSHGLTQGLRAKGRVRSPIEC